MRIMRCFIASNCLHMLSKLRSVYNSQHIRVSRLDLDTNSERVIRTESYRQRLSFHLDYIRKLGGCCLMLLFTYNNDNLPTFDYNNKPCMVFNHAHIKKFLRSLKDRMRFVNVKYSYFICSEFGETTRRPHYHILLFLEKDDDVISRKVCDICRELWHFGFMFPASGEPLSVFKVRSFKGASNYATKYVTKDLYFFGLQHVKYIDCLRRTCEDDERIIYSDMLPRIFQSVGVGLQGVKLVASNFRDAVEKGIVDPFSKKVLKPCRYFVDKTLYENVPSFDCRVGKGGHRLYDRVLRDDRVDDYVFYRCIKFSSCVSNYMSVAKVCCDDAKFNECLSYVKSSFTCPFTALALHRCFCREYSVSSLPDTLSLSVADVYNVYTYETVLRSDCDVFERYLYAEDVSDMSLSRALMTVDSHLIFCLDYCVNYLDFVYQKSFNAHSLDRVKASDLYYKMRKRRYNLNLC